MRDPRVDPRLSDFDEADLFRIQDHDTRREPMTSRFCVRCQRDIADHTTAFVVRGIPNLGPPTLVRTAVAATHPGLEDWRIGPECARRVPAGWLCHEPTIVRRAEDSA